MNLSNEQHITQDLLLRYVEDDCSRTEMREIDRHLATCPMCSDTVEGLMLLSEPTVAVAQLDKRIDAKTEEKIAEKPVGTPIEIPHQIPIFEVVKRPFWQQRWAAAAAVLLLASGSIWVYKGAQNRENKAIVSSEAQALPNSTLDTNAIAPPQYADAETAKKSSVINQSNTSLKANENISGTVSTVSGAVSTPRDIADLSDKAPLGTSLGSDKDGIVAGRKNQTAPSANVETGFYEDKNVPKVGAEAPITPTVYTPTYDRTRDYAGASAQNNVPRPTEQEAAKLKDRKDKEIGALKAEEKEQATGYKTKQDVVVSTEGKAEKKRGVDIPAKKPASAPIPMPSVTPNIPVASGTVTTTTSGGNATGVTSGTYTLPATDYDQIFNRAETYFKQKNYDAAAKEYAQFINLDTSGDRPERALFQLATCYVKLNRKAEAKILFEKLSAADGQYQRAAKKALKDL